MFKNELELVPNKPGSYQMFDKNNQIIYVGKAKDLKKRLNSYFNRTITNKTLLLVNEIVRFEYIITNTEVEAFILELNLIKKYNPKYNILLTDDKTYPYIEYVRKPFPTLKVVRYLKIKKNKDSKLFGPYPNSFAAKKVVNLINRLYPLKKCVGMPKQVCLYYHINECLGYCVKDIKQEQLDKMENDIISFLNGNEAIIKDKIKERIEFHSNNLNYEIAQSLNDDLKYMSYVLDKQRVEISDLKDKDAINYYINNGYCAVQIFFIRHGKLLEVYRNMFPIYDEIERNIEEFIIQFYENHEVPKEIILPNTLNIELLNNILNTHIIVPAKGEKKKLLELIMENSKTYLDNNFELFNKDLERTIKSNEELKKLLKLDSLKRIDIFDNSNIFGSFSVSGMVVFKNGNPAKKDYRKYKISFDKNDDYNMTKEVIYRRYYRALMEKSELPELILIDGGENQINACLSVLNELDLKIKVCGLKKNKDHYTSELVDGDTLSTYSIDKTSNLFHYLTRIQDEVHRYTITYHRNIRGKSVVASKLDTIPGIGKKRRQLLIKKIGNVDKIKNSSIEELKTIIPQNVAEKLLEILNKMD